MVTHLCNVCGKVLKSLQSFKEHSQLHQSTGRTVQCRFEGCSKRFTTLTNLKAHKYNVHVFKTATCDVCGLQVKARQLKQHQRRHLPGFKLDAQVTCHLCGATLANRPALKLHVTARHANVRDFQCGECGRSFVDKTNLRRHVEYLHLRTARKVCNVCGKTLGNAQALREHQVLHTGDRPNVCTVCNMSFRFRNELAKHRSTHQMNT